MISAETKPTATCEGETAGTWRALASSACINQSCRLGGKVGDPASAAAARACCRHQSRSAGLPSVSAGIFVSSRLWLTAKIEAKLNPSDAMYAATPSAAAGCVWGGEGRPVR